MVKVFGTITPSAGTGNKPINLGVSGVKRLFTIKAVYPGLTYISDFDGAYDIGGVQKYTSKVENLGGFAPNNRARLIDSAGVVQYEAEVTSIVGSTLNWNVITANIQPTLTLNGDDYA